MWRRQGNHSWLSSSWYLACQSLRRKHVPAVLVVWRTLMMHSMVDFIDVCALLRIQNYKNWYKRHRIENTKSKRDITNSFAPNTIRHSSAFSCDRGYSRVEPLPQGRSKASRRSKKGEYGRTRTTLYGRD